MSTVPNQQNDLEHCSALAQNMVGQQLIFQGLNVAGVPGNGMQPVILHTRNGVNQTLLQQPGVLVVERAIITEVEYYPQNTGEWAERFGDPDSRDALSGFAVPIGMGNVAAGMVMQESGRHITLIRRVLTPGEKKAITFTKLLINAGLDKEHCKGITVPGQNKKGAPPIVSAINDACIIVPDPDAEFHVTMDESGALSSEPSMKASGEHPDLHGRYKLTKQGLENARQQLS